MGFKQRSVCYILLGCMVVQPITSCTWREIGCATGGAAAMAAALALLHSKDKYTNTEKTLLISCATAVGCIIGSELVGGTAEYISIKRAEYRAEAEQITRNMEHIQESMDEMDEQLVWLEQQSNQLESASKQVKKLGVGKDMMAKKLKEAAHKRTQDVNAVEKNMKAVKSDLSYMAANTSNLQEKEKIKRKIAEIDKRILATQRVRNNILSASASVSYT